MPYMPYTPYTPYTNAGIKKDTREEGGCEGVAGRV